MDISVEIFHANCQMSWSTYNCPVCYYIKNPDLMKNSICMKCDATDSLWFCIICAHVGCGYVEHGHALEHYEETKHNYVMNLEGFSVWDYKVKQFLHNIDVKDQRLDNIHTNTQANNENTCSCPVCQHLRTPKLLKESVCMKCEESNAAQLWICLFCSHIGCGRGSNRHAVDHYTKTKHPFSMQLKNFSIWDYKEHNYLHRQLHDAVIKSEINGFGSEHMREDFEKRMDRLECEWREFSKLTEANKKMITIEERLLTLTDEKKLLEEKLGEHDAKLNELLTQIVGNRQNSCNSKDPDSDDASSASNDLLSNVKLEQDQKDFQTSTSTRSFIHNSPARASKNFKQFEFFSFLILGFFVYYLFTLILQKIFDKFMNLL